MNYPTLTPLQAAQQRQYATQALLDNTYRGNGTPTSVPHGTILIDNTGDAWQSDHQLGWRRPGVDASWTLLRKHLAPYTIAYTPQLGPTK